MSYNLSHLHTGTSFLINSIFYYVFPILNISNPIKYIFWLTSKQRKYDNDDKVGFLILNAFCPATEIVTNFQIIMRLPTTREREEAFQLNFAFEHVTSSCSWV